MRGAVGHRRAAGVRRRGREESHHPERDNPACEADVAALIGGWEGDSDEPGSPLAPGHRGSAFKDVVTGEPDLLVTKNVNSAFYGEPDLHAWLTARALVICGITTNHCVARARTASC